LDARAVELLTTPIYITDRERFTQALKTLGSDASKAEAIAAQTQKTITEKMDSDPEFYKRFSKKIAAILKRMHDGKMADIDAFEQLKLVRDDVVDKKDKELPLRVGSVAGAGIFYRNLKELFSRFDGLAEEQIITIVLDIFAIVKGAAIVDWHKNNDVKRVIRNKIDDYLYDVVMTERGVALSSDDIQRVIDRTLTLAENNYEIFS